MDTNVKISSADEFPPPPRDSSDRVVYPWGKMQHGDSILVADRAGAYSSLRYWKHTEAGRQYPHARLATRKESEGFRVWLYLLPPEETV